MRTALFYATTVLSTFLFSSMGVVCGLFRAPHRWFDWIHRNWAGSILWAAGAHLDVAGVEHSEPGRGQILIANHQSMFDIWALMAAAPWSVRFVAKAELARIPIFAAACRAAGHVFIDRKRPGQAAEAIRVAGERMRDEGLTLVLFAEGTRSADGALGTFRRGAFSLAIETRAVLLPVAIDGSAGILPRGGRRVCPGTIRIRIAPGIPLEDRTAEDRDALMVETRDAIAGLLASTRDDPPTEGPAAPARA